MNYALCINNCYCLTPPFRWMFGAGFGGTNGSFSRFTRMRTLIVFVKASVKTRSTGCSARGSVDLQLLFPSASDRLFHRTSAAMGYFNHG